MSKLTTDNKKYIIVFMKQGWVASTLSDIQTFGIMCAAFGVNSVYFGNNGWLNFCLTIAFISWVCARVITQSRKTESINSIKTSSYDEALEFLKKHEPENQE